MSGGFSGGRLRRRGYGRLQVFFRLFVLSVFSALMLAACGGSGGGAPQSTAAGGDVTPTGTESNPVLLDAISVTPADPTLPKGLTEQFTAMGTYSDGTSRDISSLVTWSSDTTAVATVDGNGLAAAVAVGSAVITASQGDVSGNTTLTVSGDTLTAIAVTPGNPTIPNGLSQQFTATGTYTNGISYDITNNVTWSSAIPAVATVDDHGFAATVAVGSSAISAELDAVSGSAMLTVSAATLKIMTIAPDNPTIPKGQTQYFTVMGIYSDGTSHDVTAASLLYPGNTAVATSYYGIVGTIYGANQGSTAITATLGGVSVYTMLTVTPATLQALSIQPVNPVVYTSSTQKLIAYGIYSDGTSEDVTSKVTWRSSDTAVATVDGSGLVMPVASSGSADISATLGDLSGSTTVTVAQPQLQSIEVTPSYSTLPLGLTQQFTATGHYSDGASKDITSLVTWSSNTTAVATVNSSGLVSSMTVGGTTIAATLGALSGNTQLWIGSATVQSITVTPTDPSVPKGLKQQLTATATYSDGSQNDFTSIVTWSSDDTSVATIDNTGLASTLKQGSAVITATYTTFSNGSFSGDTTLSVGAITLVKIKVAPADPMLVGGATQQFTATGVYSDGTTQDLTNSVTWSSGTASVAGIGSSSGLATVVGSGLDYSLITATSGSVSGSATLTRSSVTATPNDVAFQIDPGHSGQAQWNTALSLPGSTAWQVDLGGTVRYPLIANGRVFAIAVGSTEQLVALDETSGAILWGPIALSNIFSGYGGIAYDNGKVFVLNSSGLLRAFDAASGQPKWSVTLIGQNHFSSPPVAANGRIFAKGAGYLIAVDEDSGVVLWSGGTSNGTDGSPALSGNSVYLAPPCEVDSFDQATGATLWNHNYGCTGGGGNNSVVGPNNIVFKPDYITGNQILDGLTGQVIGSFPGKISPVVGDTYAYVLSGGALQSLTISSQQINWSFSGDGNLNTPALAVNDTVFVGASSGNVYALDAATGLQLWSDSAGTAISSGGSGAPVGFAAAGGYLVVPADNGLTAWKIVP